MTNKIDLRYLIDRKYGTYQALADEIGVTKQAISNVVNAGGGSATMRYAIAAALGTDPDLIEWSTKRAA